MRLSSEGLSHKRHKGLNPRSRPRVASIDAAGVQGVDRSGGGIEPSWFRLRSHTDTKISAQGFGALLSVRSP